jgi:hypothetical protein
VELARAVSLGTWTQSPSAQVEARSDGVKLPVSAFAVSIASNLRVTCSEREHMPIYLRAFFRVLSSWVHSARGHRLLSCSG